MAKGGTSCRPLWVTARYRLGPESHTPALVARLKP
jgi:hypothetical protein